MRKRSFEYYCDNIENVENYDAAKADNFKGWLCHHRLELMATGGVCDVSRQDLIDWGIYYDRPADELIFLTKSEHSKLHSNSKEAKRNMSKVHKGKLSWNKGKKMSEEFCSKLSKAKKGMPHKGIPRSEECRRKIAEAHKGKHWKLVDGKRVYK